MQFHGALSRAEMLQYTFSLCALELDMLLFTACLGSLRVFSQVPVAQRNAHINKTDVSRYVMPYLVYFYVIDPSASRSCGLLAKGPTSVILGLWA